MLNTNDVQGAILRGLFQEKFVELDTFKGQIIAPLRSIDATKGSYNVLETDYVFDTTAGGYDALVPLSTFAPSRPLAHKVGVRHFVADRYAENIQYTDLQLDDLGIASGGLEPSDVERSMLSQLVAFHAGRHSAIVGDLVNNAANYANTGSIDFSDATEDVVGKIDAAVRAVRRSNGASRILIVMNPTVAAALRLNESIRSLSGPGVYGGQVSSFQTLSGIFKDQFNAELVVEGTDKKVGGIYVPVIGDNTLSVVAASGLSEYEATFAHTVTKYDSVEGIVDVYMEETRDPRGWKMIGESVFKAEVVDKGAGYRFEVTI